ncbi:hypothetical protein SCB71_09550 [Herbiconiux sp. KACC 21604]|uniref:hypothetical protein n=1 Tax=unclassified Herbiconiux TaxID=2618217 RepID=UPI0014912354|nr:hypothetical protein [Herbiconiux sp. SALV-R1]QJU53489.1 hypothetical protein HL652_07505 [Herbiconiux sp. SALV-R1]WPO88465.1 hypothetical protein SCB71_09550 [Herbiconiux sp. KACC 21604]
MRVRGTATIAGVITTLTVAVLTGCSAGGTEGLAAEKQGAEASVSPAPTRTPAPTATTTPTEAPTPSATPEVAAPAAPGAPAPGEQQGVIPETTSDQVIPDVFSWKSINGTWCPESGDCIEIFDYGTGTGNNRFVMQQTGAPDGCLLGTAWHPEYPGSMVMICPAWTPTPAAPFGTSTSYEAVTGDDYTRDRMWFFQGLGSPTFFRP